MRDIWITHSWAGRTKRSLTIPLFISTLVSWRLRPIHDGRVFCCFSEQRKAEGGREESSCYIGELTHVISSLLTHWKDPMTLHPRACDISVSSLRNKTSLVLLEGRQGNFYPLSCFLVTLFLNNSQSGKHWTLRTISYCFQFVLSPHWPYVVKEENISANLSEWAWRGCSKISEPAHQSNDKVI